jgi:hypothetical protein
VKYTLENGKVVNIPDDEIANSMKRLEISKEEAVEMWLCDNDLEENEELTELDARAKKVKINHGAGAAERKKSEKPRTVKVSDEKKELFSTILQNLDRAIGVERENIQVLKENKLISVKIGEKTFKIDIIEQRTPKK